jgi:hypothetical protein
MKWKGDKKAWKAQQNCAEVPVGETVPEPTTDTLAQRLDMAILRLIVEHEHASSVHGSESPPNDDDESTVDTAAEHVPPPCSEIPPR